MSVVEELIKNEADGGLSFGNHRLKIKSKLSDFAHKGDLYKVKTYSEVTKLEKNGNFIYESIPGTSVNNLKFSNNTISFVVEGAADAQITLGLEEETDYEVFIDNSPIGVMKTNLSGKLVIGVELDDGNVSEIKIVKADKQ
ncbi:endosialidase [Johnsonella ignava]|uniref:endosialidase n=1 Tax=Johnsonella ignava TaxID=43995 RepID=UPI0023F18DD7|nr:endosialidase [Johnsonella ignava]